MNTYDLKRLAYVIRKTVQTDLAESASGALLEAFAEEIGHGFAAYLKIAILGRLESASVELDIPDGRWQALKAACGLPYRRKHLTFTASVLFPSLCPLPDKATISLDRDKTIRGI